MQSNNHLEDVWELYGVRENPFSTSPILVMGGSIPIESFVGRGDQVRKLSRIIASRGGSRTFVYGDIGIGKTSFVNVVRNSAFDKGYFTHFKEITTQDKWSADELILNTLSAIYSTLKLMKQKPISDATYKKLESLFEIGRKSFAGGVSIAGFGGNFESNQSTEIISSVSLQSFFSEVVEEINDITKKEMIIHYNNLELVSEKKIRHLFDTLRDFFQTRGVHFIFIGNLTAYSILQSVPRFSSILSDLPLQMGTLTYAEVKEIIKKRFESLRINKNLNLINPYTDDCLQTLYELMNGNIRDILNSLSTAVFHATAETPILLDKNRIANVLKRVLEVEFFAKITPKEKQVLLEIVKHDEITNKSLSDRLKIPRSNISSYIKSLENNGCVFLRRKNGKDKFWKADPKIRWSLLKETPQKSLAAF